MEEKQYVVTITLTKYVVASNDNEAYEKAFNEFTEDGINPNGFYVYVNGKEIN